MYCSDAKRLSGLLILLLMGGVSLPAAWAAQGRPDSLLAPAASPQAEGVARQAALQPPSEGTRWHEKVPSLSFHNAGLREVLQALALQKGLNLVIDSAIGQQISVHVQDITPWEFLTYLRETYHLDLSWSGGILTVKPGGMEVEVPAAPDKHLSVAFEDSLLTIEVRQVPLAELVDRIGEVTGYNILADQRIKTEVSGRLRQVPFLPGIKALMKHNGLSVSYRGGIVYVEEAILVGRGPGGRSSKQWISVGDEDLVSMDLVEAPIQSVIKELSDLSQVQIFSYGNVQGTITARVERLPFIDALEYLLKGSQYTHKLQAGVVMIGDKNLKGIVSTEVIKLDHFMSDRVVELLPANLKGGADIQVVKELNAVAVTATNDVISEIRSFIESIDKPVAQILLEALVVDYNLTRIRELDIKAGLDEAKGATAVLGLFPFLKGTAGAGALKAISNLPSVIAKNVGILPDDFYLTLSLLEEEGYVNVQSKPHLATLNGHKASLVVSTTQYFKFTSEVVIPSPTNPTVSTSERFEQVTAEIKLEITPWVSASGEITVEIRPEFSTPTGGFDPDVPPTINSRIIETTVRVQDGETIVLGGLIQETTEETRSKVPILGNIPLLGRLFQGTTDKRTKSELVIYLTPHINMAPVQLPQEE